MPDDDYSRALARLDGMPGLGDLYYLVRALLLERQSAESGGLTDEKVKLYEAANAALREFAGGKGA